MNPSLIGLHRLGMEGRINQRFTTTWQFVAWTEKREPDRDLRL